MGGGYGHKESMPDKRVMEGKEVSNATEQKHPLLFNENPLFCFYVKGN